MSYQTLDLFDLIDESEQNKPAPPQVERQTHINALIAAYNKEKKRTHQDGDVYMLDSGSCFHHLAE